MKNYKFTVDSSQDHQRLDKFLVGHLPKDISRTHIQQLIRDEHISVNNLPSKSNHLLKKPDLITVTIPDPVALELKAENIPLDIVYEDSDLLVVNKPVGMIVHPGAGNISGTLVNALLYHCKNLSGINGVLRPGIVHRLDKDTSGLMVVAKNDQSHLNLAQQMKERKIKRKYLTLVKDTVQMDEGIVNAPIGRSPNNRQKMAVVFDRGREAITNYKVLKRLANSTVLEVTLQTGRTHQVRVHMAYLGHPVLGDKVYGRKEHYPRQLLHAFSLSFTHPTSQKYMEFSAPIPQDINEVLEGKQE